MNSLKLLALSVFVAVFILGAGGVLAYLPSFDELDRDGNGYISSAEAMALPCLADNFHRIQSAGDQGLSREEYAAALAQFCPPDAPEPDWMSSGY